MRIAAFSDIHSNSVAFLSCLKKAETIGFDACVLLGDYVSDCAYPERTMEIISDIQSRYPTEMVKGNREEYLLNHLQNPSDDWKYGSKTGSLLYTFESLSKNALQLFKSMPISKQIAFPDFPPFEIAHGSFLKSRAMVLPGNPDLEDVFSSMKTSLTLVGHSHRMLIMQRGLKTIANGGPVGVPSWNLPGASFLMLELKKGAWKCSIHRTDYDIDRVIHEMDESGLTEKSNVWARGIKAMLKTGREYLMEALEIVSSLSYEFSLPESDERLWEEAAKRLHI